MTDILTTHALVNPLPATSEVRLTVPLTDETLHLDLNPGEARDIARAMMEAADQADRRPA